MGHTAAAVAAAADADAGGGVAAAAAAADAGGGVAAGVATDAAADDDGSGRRCFGSDVTPALPVSTRYETVLVDQSSRQSVTVSRRRPRIAMDEHLLLRS